MKKLILIALIITVSYSTKAQTFPTHFDFDTDSSVMILNTKEIIKSKDSLYMIAKNWIATTYNSANTVVQIDDKTNGHIIGKGSHIFGTGLLLKYTIEIFVKENKYRLYIHNLYFDYLDHTEDFTSVYKDYLALVKSNPSKAKWKYELRIDESHSALINLSESLEGAIKGVSDKSNF